MPAPKKAAARKAAVSDAEAIKGVWREVKNQDQVIQGVRTWTFQGDTVTISEDGKTYTGTFTLDESASPKSIDTHFEGYPVNKGIYELKGNVLRVKVLDSAVERPSKWDVENGYTLIELSRSPLLGQVPGEKK